MREERKGGGEKREQRGGRGDGEERELERREKRQQPKIE